MSECIECCGLLTEDEKAERAAEKVAEKQDMEKSVNINGTDFKLKDLFQDHWAASDFANKITIIEKAQEKAPMSEVAATEMLIGKTNE